MKDSSFGKMSLKRVEDVPQKTIGIIRMDFTRDPGVIVGIGDKDGNRCAIKLKNLLTKTHPWSAFARAY